MKFKRPKPYTLGLVKDVLFEDIRKSGLYGLSLRHLLSRRGISRNLEEDRSKVWKCVSALVSLQNDGTVVSEIIDGERVYFPRNAA